MNQDIDYDWVIDGGYIPQSLARLVIRQVLKSRQAVIDKKSLAEVIQEKLSYVAKSRTLPIAIETKAANLQQYEISNEVFRAFLGPRMKYSCSIFSTGNESLAKAETETLQQYIERAEIENGMTILDLGCGWGSATLYLAEQFPASKVIGFSNSKTQKQYIEEEASRNNLRNIEIITGDISNFEFEAEQFDRVVSIELFEHMKNYEALMSKVSMSLKPGGKLFVHIFSHRNVPYDFDEGWMSRYFFTGGTMPSADLLLYFQRDLQIRKQWWISGLHYSKTLETWLSNFTANKQQIWPFLIETYGEQDAAVWYNRWLFYFIGGSEFFGTRGGEENGISQYLFEKPLKA